MRHTLATGLVWCLATTVAWADLTVDDDGPADYATIQEAVDNATPGEAILVAPGLYAEEVTVSTPVRIIGAGIGQTVVVPATSRPGDGPGDNVDNTAWVFRIAASDVTIAYLSIRGDNPAIGGDVDARGGIITDATAGEFDNLLVTGVEVEGTSYRGISVAAGGSGHTLISNTVHDIDLNPFESTGLMLYDAAGEVRGNDVDRCAVGIATQAGEGGLICLNTVSTCTVGILSLANRAALTVDQNTLEDCDQGIQCAIANAQVDLTENVSTGHTWGIALFGLGTGQYLVEGNELNGSSAPGSAGMYISTDVGALGTGPVVGMEARSNRFVENDIGVVINEPAVDLSHSVNVTLSGALEHRNDFIGSMSFNVFLENTDDPIDATWNDWGVADPIDIENSIWHQVDDALLGFVDASNPVNLFVTVDDDGGADFLEINPAIQAVLPGATVMVMPGTYEEDIVIDRPLTLTGSGTDADPSVGTVLRGLAGTPEEAVITVASDDVVIENLRIDGFVVNGDNKIRRGIYAALVENLLVQDNVIHGAVSCAETFQCQGLSFVRNECFDFGRGFDEGGGIVLGDSIGSVGALGAANIIRDGFAPGIAFVDGSSGDATGNRVISVAVGLLTRDCDAATTIEGNDFRSCTQGVQSISNAATVTFVDNVATECLIGFSFFPSHDEVFVGNLVDGMGSGLTGVYASTEAEAVIGDVHLDAEANAIVGCQFGVYLEETIDSIDFWMGVDLSGQNASNTFSANSQADIYLAGCDDDIPASFNQFVTDDSAEVESRIWHQNDDLSLGLVAYAGFTDYGPELHIYGGFEDQSQVLIHHIGQPNRTVFMFIAFGEGVIPTPFGNLLLDPITLKNVLSGTTGATGLWRVTAPISGDVASGVPLFFQSIILDDSPAGGAVTNREDVTTR